MKKRKFLLLILGVCLASPAIAGGRLTPLGELRLSETNLRGAHCDGADKGASDSALIEGEQKGKIKKAAATSAQD